MKTSGFWQRDAFLGLVVSLLVLAAAGAGVLQGLERAAYDMGVRASERTPSDRVAVIAIDDTSIANIGRWPWSRDVHARMTDLLAGAGAKVIGNTILFPEPEVSAGYPYIRKLQEMLEAGKVEGVLSPELEPYEVVLQEAEGALATDRRLAASYQQAGSVALPFLFQLGAPLGRPDQELPEFISKYQVMQVQPGQGYALPATHIQFPIAQLAGEVAVLGHLNYTPDVDGSIRSEPLVIDYYGQYYPSLALMLAAHSLNLGADDISVRLG